MKYHGTQWYQIKPYGHGFEATELFKRMNVACIRPTRITIYCGLVEEGRKLFEAMKLDYGFVIDGEHFSCMAQIPVELIVEYSNWVWITLA